MRNDETLLLDMLLAAQNILEFAHGLSEEDFMNSKLHQSATIREVQVIGEAARQISEQTKSKHPDIQWKAILGMRNRVIHEYFRVDLDILWQTIQNDIKPLINQIRPLIPPGDSD